MKPVNFIIEDKVLPGKKRRALKLYVQQAQGENKQILLTLCFVVVQQKTKVSSKFTLQLE